MAKVPTACQCKQTAQTLTLQTHFLLLPNRTCFSIKAGIELLDSTARPRERHHGTLQQNSAPVFAPHPY